MSYVIWDENKRANQQISRAAFIWARLSVGREQSPKGLRQDRDILILGEGVLDVQGAVRVTRVREA